MARKKTFQIFREVKTSGPYDERPMLPDTIDVQVHLSRNERAQPFFLICEKDTLIAQVAGDGHVEFKETSVARFTLAPGDYVYVPAGAPHRLYPQQPSSHPSLRERRHDRHSTSIPRARPRVRLDR